MWTDISSLPAPGAESSAALAGGRELLEHSAFTRGKDPREQDGKPALEIKEPALPSRCL